MIFHTVEKSGTKKVYPAWAGFHAVEKMGQIVPHRGNIISTLWKNQAKLFHGVETAGALMVERPDATATRPGGGVCGGGGCLK